jgi:tRNA splicing endonuclease
VKERLLNDPTLIQEYAILEALRVPGNKVVLHQNFSKLGIDNCNSWGIRWASDKHPARDEPDSEVIWFNSSELLSDKSNQSHSLESILQWSNEVHSKDRISEVLVVDEEKSVVTYRISESDPTGVLRPPDFNEFQRISELKSIDLGEDGVFIIQDEDWAFDAIGLPVHGGRQLEKIEYEVVQSVTNQATKNMSVSSSLVLDLWKRGLNTRSGFKYGTKWRCYPSDVGEGHAPWLVVDPSSDNPKNWAEACLSSRLASGVNKHWLYPINDRGNGWRYLQISRPPSDSRWSNPIRH